LTTRAQKSILFIYPERNQCYSAKNDWKEGTHTCGDEDLQNMQTADAREFLWLGSSCFLLISLTPSKYSSLTAPSSVFEDNNFDGGVCLPQLVANCRPRPDSFSHLVFYGTSSFSYRPAEITSAAGTNPASRRNLGPIPHGQTRSPTIALIPCKHQPDYGQERPADLGGVHQPLKSPSFGWWSWPDTSSLSEATVEAVLARS
jgi:hypothetical protein